MRVPLRTFRPLESDRGAVLPLTALLLVTLLVFAAFAVDLGAAWGERRQDQTAADAAVMAGAIEYIRGNPTEAEVVALVKDYVERNIGFSAADPGWANTADGGSCDPPTGGFQPIDGNNCISLRQASTESSDTLLKVRLPNQAVPTSFARVIGIDTINVTAEAVARIEQQPGVQGALPFALPSNPGTEYCIGTMPFGHSRDLCDGPDDGNFGLLDSPWFGAADDPWGTTGCFGGQTITRLNMNTAIGIDHFLRIAPDNADPSLGVDSCAATQGSGYVPYAVNAKKGNSVPSDGLIADASYGTVSYPPPPDSPVSDWPGRLRQVGGLSSPQFSLSIRGIDGSHETLDNVGLWEYLIDPTDDTDECHSDRFDPPVGPALEGIELTAQLIDCLEDGTPKFRNALLASPRFALVPQLDITLAEIGSLSTSQNFAINIIQFMPVYLQASWFNCNNNDCLKFESGDGTTWDAFEPGEGDLDASGLNGNLSLDGLTAFILDPDGTGSWLPDAFDNQFNEPGAFNVYLYR